MQCCSIKDRTRGKTTPLLYSTSILPCWLFLHHFKSGMRLYSCFSQHTDFLSLCCWEQYVAQQLILCFKLAQALEFGIRPSINR
mmetsp:Transcript_900/g.2559  ORF Transcript_900/g.2559 Transcript_900/m.2559 type:complete len:84 (+) Transcript_900:1398-1649(+)